jgi:hypothetical protein
MQTTGKYVDMERKLDLRLDFKWQSEVVHAILSPWIVGFWEESGQTHDESYMDSGCEIWHSHNWKIDTNIRLEMTADGPTVSGTRWLLSQFECLRTGAKTLRPHSQYVGYKDPDVLFKESTKKPSKAVIDQSLAGLTRFLLGKELEFSDLKEGVKTMVHGS